MSIELHNALGLVPNGVIGDFCEIVVKEIDRINHCLRKIDDGLSHPFNASPGREGKERMPECVSQLCQRIASYVGGEGGGVLMHHLRRDVVAVRSYYANPEAREPSYEKLKEDAACLRHQLALVLATHPLPIDAHCHLFDRTAYLAEPPKE